jgi:diadenosine tetraphosphate (Ap4A) HIT family hydrolase
MPNLENTTVFERVWREKPEQHLFKSDQHGVMAAVDIRPRLPYQVIIAPRDGQPGSEAHFTLLPFEIQQKLLFIAQQVGMKILAACGPDHKVLYSVTGFQVKDHAHLVMAAAREGDLSVLQDGPVLGDLAVRRTLNAINFSPAEADSINSQLDGL